MSETTGTSAAAPVRLSRRLAGLALQSVGWSVVGAPPDLPRFLVVIAPHRSARDLFLGLLLIAHSGLNVHWLAKHTLFWWPLGAILRALGGISVDRRSANGVVEKLGGTFGRHPQFILALMPEGSRSRAGAPVRDWKSGYFHIANAAGVPVLPIAVDSERKRFVFGQPLPASDGREALAADLQTFFDQALMRDWG